MFKTCDFPRHIDPQAAHQPGAGGGASSRHSAHQLTETAAIREFTQEETSTAPTEQCGQELRADQRGRYTKKYDILSAS